MKSLTIATAFALTITAAAAQTTKQKNAINHAAQALIGAERCGRITANRATIILMLKLAGVDISEPRFEKELLARMDKSNRELAGSSKEDICTATLVLYGPSGANVPGFVQEK